MTRSLLAAVVFGVCSSACGERGQPESPFALWTLRPGDSLAVVEDRVRRMSRFGLDCVPNVRPFRHCVARSEGMPLTGVSGRIDLIVDSTDRILLIQFRRMNDYLPGAVRGRINEEWNAEVRGFRAAWDSVRDVHTGVQGVGDNREQRWLSKDSLWSASMLMEAGDTVAALTLADERKLESLRASSPLAGPVLASAVRFPMSENAQVEIFTAMMQARGDDGLTAAVGAAPRSDAPVCDLELADIVLPSRPGDGRGSARANLGEALAGTLELAVPIAYPGWKLAFGQDTYLIDANGVAEKVRITSKQDHETYGVVPAEAIYAIAIYRVRRADSARRRITEFRVAEHCAARSDILFIRKAADGSIAESVVVPLDEEALITQVSEMAFARLRPERTTLVVSYLATYGSAGWTGDIHWTAILPTDPPRVDSRALTAFVRTHRDPAAETIGGSVLYRRLSGDTLLFQTLEGVEGRLSTRQVRMPLENGRVLRATALLESLR